MGHIVSKQVPIFMFLDSPAHRSLLFIAQFYVEVSMYNSTSITFCEVLSFVYSLNANA